MLLCFGAFAQTEINFDFNNCAEETPLNGQDGWIARPHSAGNGGRPLYTGYLAHFFNGTPEQPTPDETIGVFSYCTGTSFGDIATRSIADYGFNFASGGIIEIECDMWREWWGDFFGISATMAMATDTSCPRSWATTSLSARTPTATPPTAASIC